MFILTPEDIEYCELHNSKVSPNKKYNGLYYRGFYFIQVACFSLKELKQAIKKCRQILDEEEQITSIVVKEANRITLWSHHFKLNLDLSRMIVPFSDDSSLSNLEKSKENCLKYRGKTIIKKAKNNQNFLQKEIKSRKKKLKYRGSSY
ncbi:MAG: hypothetical protein QNJ38_16640 [Prochloraceae cyanobacterium]|nr:hypothetical protein [Prochloraceae cyanobacterium]